MRPGRPILIVALGVALLVLLAGALLVLGRARRDAAPPTSAATAVAQATPAPDQVATAPPTAAPATATPTATPAPAPTGQTILSFGVPQTVKCDASGQPTSLHLTWTTAAATGVSISIDGPGKFADYPASGSADLPFGCSEVQHTYLLTTHGSGPPATRTVVVKRAA
jgi:hypothetical protein